LPISVSNRATPIDMPPEAVESSKPAIPPGTRIAAMEQPSNPNKELFIPATRTKSSLSNDPVKLSNAALIKPLARPPLPQAKPRTVEKTPATQLPPQNNAKLQQHLVLVDRHSLSLTGRRGENAGWQEYTAQVASLTNKAEARALAKRIRSNRSALVRGVSTRITRATVAGVTRYTVGFGPLPTHKAAVELCQSLIAAGEGDCIVWPPWSLKRASR